MYTNWFSFTSFVAVALLLTPPSNGNPISSTMHPGISNPKFQIVIVGKINHRSTHIPMYIPQCETITNEANETHHEIEVKPLNNDNQWFQLSKCVCAFEKPLCEGTGKTVPLNGTNVTLDNFRLKSVQLCRPDWQKRQDLGKRICE